MNIVMIHLIQIFMNLFFLPNSNTRANLSWARKLTRFHPIPNCCFADRDNVQQIVNSVKSNIIIENHINILFLTEKYMGKNSIITTQAI